MNIETRIEQLKELGLEVVNQNNSFIYTRGDIEVGEEMFQMSDGEFIKLIINIGEFMVANPAEYPLDIKMNTESTPTKELTIIDKAKETLLSGGAVLQRSLQKSNTYVSAANALIDKIIANGDVLNAELDLKANEALIKIKKAVDDVDEDTKPIRQAMVMIRDELTGCTKAMLTKADIIQKYRNEWAKAQKKADDDRKEAERLAGIKRQEVINVTADIEKALLKHFNDHLLLKKQGVNMWFNAITLADFETKSISLEQSHPIYDTSHFILFKYNYVGTILNHEEVLQLTKDVCSEDRFQQLFSTYQAEMLELKHEKIDLLPSKKNELECIAAFEKEQEEERKKLAAIEEEKKKATAARQIELKKLEDEAKENQRIATQKLLEQQQEQADRENEEAATLKSDNEKKMNEHNTKIDVSAAQATTISLFEEVANTTPVVSNTKVKTVLKAVITNPVGIYPIFQLWMENVGMKLQPEELMKEFSKQFTYASKRANDKQPLMLDTQINGKATFVKYIEDTKAVNTKNKKEELV